MNKYHCEDIWSALPFRIAEIIIGLMLATIGTYIFIINFATMSRETSIFGLILIPIFLIIYAVPAFIGFIIIISGAFGKDPAIVAKNNIKVLLLVALISAVVISIESSIIEIVPNDIYINKEISLGDLFAPLAILISIATISYGWLKDQQQRKKEYSDKIRSAAGTIMAIMDRRNSLNERFFENIQPILLDSISILIKTEDNKQAREFLWKEIVKEGMNISQRRHEEPLEEAFRDLYGYDSKLQKAFTDTMSKLIKIEGFIYNITLILFQIEMNDVRISHMHCEQQLEHALLVYNKIFSWDQIPGKDNEKLIGFLGKMNICGWIKNESFKKIDDNKNINASADKHTLSLELNDKKTKVVLKIDGERRNELMAKMENEEINVYEIGPGYIQISKENLVTNLRTTASMLRYEQKYLADAVISSFKNPLRNIVSSNDDQIFNKSVDLSLPPLTESWMSALDGLKLCTQEKFEDAVESYEQALKKEKYVEGFWAGKSLAHLGYLDLKNWDDATKMVINIVRNK